MLVRRRSLRICTYAVALDSDVSRDEVRALANYLSTLDLADCEVLVVDGSSSELFDEHDRVLRWVSRHVAVRPHARFIDGRVDLIQAATEFATTEKLIIAAGDSRYTSAEVRAICALLDHHDVVEPEEYFDPLPWWGGVDAGRVLLHRGAAAGANGGSTFAFRRAAFLVVRDVPDRSGRNEPRRLALQGAELHQARGVFVRREPQRFGTWLRLRPREASAELIAPMKTLFFLTLIPLVALLFVIGGGPIATGFGIAIATGAMMLALRGRAGAAKFFPLRACLFAPLWIAERSVSVYWALFDRLRGATVHAGVGSQVVVRSSQVG